jgi:predicted nuclease of predicted toxin-antitoxin system
MARRPEGIRPVKLLIDMNLSPRWVDFLSNAGFEARHWSKLGAKSTPDPAFVTYARTHGYVVFTCDMDFNAIIAVTQGAKPSIVVISARDPSPDLVGEQVLAALRIAGADLERGALAAIDSPRKRMWVLPLME